MSICQSGLLTVAGENVLGHLESAEKWVEALERVGLDPADERLHAWNIRQYMAELKTLITLTRTRFKNIRNI